MWVGGCPPWGTKSHLGRRRWFWKRRSLCWGGSPSSSAPSSDRASSSPPRAYSRTRAAWACPWFSGRPVESCHFLVSVLLLWRGVAVGLSGRAKGYFWGVNEWQILPEIFWIFVVVVQVCALPKHTAVGIDWILLDSFLQATLLSFPVWDRLLWLFSGVRRAKTNFDDPESQASLLCRVCEAGMLRALWQLARWLKHLWGAARMAYLHAELDVQNTGTDVLLA